MKILVLNGGSSSFKFWYGDITGPQKEWDRPPDLSLDAELKSVPGPVEVVGHRIVHGGRAYRESTRITPEARAAIAQQAELAPAHNRLELEAIEAVDRVFGSDLPQVAVFDTAFHSTLEPPAFVYPGPYEWLDQGIRRFGFHGISHQYASRQAAHLLGRDLNSLRLITCHLGNGASLAAVRGGRSIDTTMGFTPLEGIMMGTRSGSIDPGIIIYLIRHRGYTADQLDRILNQESGLRGVSGLTGDMREILKHIAQGNERAQLAFDVYVHRLCRGIGAMLGSLGGLDALVFTGGIGENCAPLRERVAKQFEFLGKIPILVIKAQEDWEIARECHRIIAKRNAD
jgi:acetate kinase